MNSFGTKLFLLVSIFLMLHNISFGITPQEQQILNQQLIIQQQQEQRRQQEQNQLQIDDAEKIRRTRVENNNIEDIVNDDTVPETKNCIRFNRIEIVGNKKYSTKYLKRKVLNKYLEKCINKRNIDSIINSLMKIYVENGYSTTRIYFDISKIRSENTFIFVVDEGKINNIIMKEIRKKKSSSKKKEVDKASFLNRYMDFRLKSQIFFAFPMLKGKVFNLKDIEQGLDQINRLQSNNATLDIEAADNASASSSNIIINNQKSRSTHFDFSIDNSGNKSTGEKLMNFSINQDNLLSVNDNIYLKYTQDMDTENSKRYNKSFYGNISIPLGYWTFNPSISYSKYLTTINGYYTSFHTSGSTLSQIYNIDRVMIRSQLYRLNLGTNLEIRDTKSYIRDTKSITGSRKSSNINLYLNNIIYTKLGTIIIKPSYQRGLGWFGSKKDEKGLLNIEPKLQYDLLKLYAYYNTRINIPLFTKTQVIDPNTGQPAMIKNKNGDELIPYKIHNKINLLYTLTFDSQYSFDTLYGTNQFSIGGEYTIRGFRDSTISGDNGYYIRNDLRIAINQLIPRFILNTKWMNWGHIIKGKQYSLSLNDALSRTYLSMFYDYGYVVNRYKIPNDNYNSNSGYMSGFGVALNYYGKYFNWSLTYAKPLHSPKYLQSRDGIKKENHSLYWRIGGRF